METIYFPALPTIFGLKLQLRLQIFLFSVIFFGIIVMLWYFVIKYRRRKQLHQQMDNMKQETVALNQKMLLNKMSESDGKLFLILYIEYLEKFTTNKSYSSIEELL